MSSGHPRTSKNLLSFIADRFPVDKLNFHHMVEEKRVPIHRMSWGYYTGGLTALFFLIQVVTGLFCCFTTSLQLAMLTSLSNLFRTTWLAAP